MWTHWRTQIGGGARGFNPPLNLQIFLNCVFAKYTVQALLPYSLNPKFSTGKRWKLYTIFTSCFSFWGLRPLPRLCLWTPLGDGSPPDPLPCSATWTPSNMKSWVRLCVHHFNYYQWLIPRRGMVAEFSKRMFLNTHNYSNLGYCSSLL